MGDIGVKAVFAVVATILTEFFGGFDKLLTTLIVLIIADYITGVLAAVYKKELSSDTGLKGVIKKVMQLFIVGVAASLDSILNLSDPYIRTTVIYFLMANEGISILENAAAAGAPVPGFLLKILAQLKDKEGVN